MQRERAGPRLASCGQKLPAVASSAAVGDAGRSTASAVFGTNFATPAPSSAPTQMSIGYVLLKPQ